ncbi:NAD(P)/FAD-dependent oxidoreductase, partial [Aureimonas sp. SK2]|uniref:NAD(P)/FAD-dependent oxidoreductase n=1 Tax=Aureimonas sp. SK2 TaxID=3015992 RepID=UPI002443F736
GRDIVPARSVSYDTLVLAVGSEANDFGTPGAGRHCVTINSRGQAIAFNDRMRIELLHAVAQDRTFGVAIVGGGATGVELAAEIVQLAEIVQGYGISGLRERIRVTLIDTGDRLLRAFPERISHAVAARLREMGVEVNLNVKVVSVDEEAFHLSDGKIVRAEMKVWVAGVRPPHLLSTIEGIQLSKLGQIVVGDDLRSVDDRSIVGVGDCASPRFADASILVPTTAQAASQEADYLVRHLPTLIAGGTAPAFQYRDFGSLVSLGGYDAYGTLGRVGLFRGGFLKGRVAQLGHALLYRRHQARLHGLGRGSLLWLADVLNARVRPRARLT